MRVSRDAETSLGVTSNASESHFVAVSSVPDILGRSAECGSAGVDENERLGRFLRMDIVFGAKGLAAILVYYSICAALFVDNVEKGLMRDGEIDELIERFLDHRPFY